MSSAKGGKIFDYSVTLAGVHWLLMISGDNGVIYILARNAKGKFLIRRTKIALDQPASYVIIPGKLKISNVSLKIQEEDLRGEIAAEKGILPFA